MSKNTKTAPALETQRRQGDEYTSITPSADVILTKKDLCCIARILQGSIYGDSLFQYCDCCPHADDCQNMAQQSHTNYFNQVRPKLQNVTGVYLGPLVNENLIRGKIIPGTPAMPPAR